MIARTGHLKYGRVRWNSHRRCPSVGTGGHHFGPLTNIFGTAAFRKLNDEARARRFAALDPDLAMLELDELFDNRQTNTSAASRFRVSNWL
jgi:hypothetical protein